MSHVSSKVGLLHHTYYGCGKIKMAARGVVAVKDECRIAICPCFWLFQSLRGLSFATINHYVALNCSPQPCCPTVHHQVLVHTYVSLRRNIAGSTPSFWASSVAIGPYCYSVMMWKSILDQLLLKRSNWRRTNSTWFTRFTPTLAVCSNILTMLPLLLPLNNPTSWPAQKHG